jgi:hypothetical protein
VWGTVQEKKEHDTRGLWWMGKDSAGMVPTNTFSVYIYLFLIFTVTYISSLSC